MKVITSDEWAYFGKEGNDFVFLDKRDRDTQIRSSRIKFVDRKRNLVFFFQFGKVSLSHASMKRLTVRRSAEELLRNTQSAQL